MKDRLELAMERIDQQAETIAALERDNLHLRKVRDELADMVKQLEEENEMLSTRYHALVPESTELVTKAQHRHLRCAVEHGCPREYAL